MYSASVLQVLSLRTDVRISSSAPSSKRHMRRFTHHSRIVVLSMELLHATLRTSFFEHPTHKIHFGQFAKFRKATISFILIRSNKMQQYSGVYLLQYYSTCFGCPSHPSSREHKILTAASGTSHSI